MPPSIRSGKPPADSRSRQRRRGGRRFERDHPRLHLRRRGPVTPGTPQPCRRRRAHYDARGVRKCRRRRQATSVSLKSSGATHRRRWLGQKVAQRLASQRTPRESLPLSADLWPAQFDRPVVITLQPIAPRLGKRRSRNPRPNGGMRVPDLYRFGQGCSCK